MLKGRPSSWLAGDVSDELLFRVERSRAQIAKTPDFLSLGGSLPVPAGKRGSAWDDVLRKTRRTRSERRH